MEYMSHPAQFKLVLLSIALTNECLNWNMFSKIFYVIRTLLGLDSSWILRCEGTGMLNMLDIHRIKALQLKCRVGL